MMLQSKARFRLVYPGRSAILCAIAWAAANGCTQEAPCPDAAPDMMTNPVSSEQVFRDSADPYTLGNLAVQTISVERCQDAAPVPMLIHTPTAAGDYPVVVLQHGFLARNSDYDEILAHLASHGFIVVAPQMYEPGLGPLTGQPSTSQEAEWAGQVLDWLSTRLASLVGVSARTDLLGLVGHSRGSRVALLALLSNSSRAKAVVLMDPADRDPSPFGDQTRILDGPFELNLPSLIIGAGVSGNCAPPGENHEQFYDAVAAPAWHVVATDYGHVDMLDEDAAEANTAFCGSGQANREPMRRLVAGLLTAFFRGTLQGESAALSILAANEAAPARITAELK
jgi:chlorophyllase